MTVIKQNQGPSVGPSVRGVASGVLFVAFFSTLWAAVGLGGLQGLSPAWLIAAVAAIGLVLAGGGVYLLRASRRLAGPVAKGGGERQGKTRWFRIILVTEFALIAAARLVLFVAGRLDLFVPAMMLIVGVHFLPLAALFRVKMHYVAGALLCALAILTPFVVPQQLRLSGIQISAWWVVLGFCGALVLWGDAVALWLRGKRLLDQKKRRNFANCNQLTMDSKR